MRRPGQQTKMRTCCRSIRLAYDNTGQHRLDALSFVLRPSFQGAVVLYPRVFAPYCVRYLPLCEYRRFRAFLYFLERFSCSVVRESTERCGANVLNGDGATSERWEACTEIVRLWWRRGWWLLLLWLLLLAWGLLSSRATLLLGLRLELHGCCEHGTCGQWRRGAML